MICQHKIGQKCSYCGITLKQIYVLAENIELFAKVSRGYTMEIDQKYANAGYSNDNCVASFYWCNNAKIDEFTYYEFKMIAKSIRLA